MRKPDLAGGGTRQGPPVAESGMAKGGGPFDTRSFDGVKQYAVFWLGEKCEGSGFFEVLIRDWTGR
jgi:hypothetical protein